MNNSAKAALVVATLGFAAMLLPAFAKADSYMHFDQFAVMPDV